jgi:hypothetical protein
MSIIRRKHLPVKSLRRTPHPAEPFAAGLVEPARLSDEEQRALDEIRGDWPPADVDLDAEGGPATWGDWADDYRFVPTREEEGWAARELNRDASARRRDVVAASMINPCLARAIANGTISLN